MTLRGFFYAFPPFLRRFFTEMIVIPVINFMVKTVIKTLLGFCAVSIVFIAFSFLVYTNIINKILQKVNNLLVFIIKHSIKTATNININGCFLINQNLNSQKKLEILLTTHLRHILPGRIKGCLQYFLRFLERLVARVDQKFSRKLPRT